MATKTIVTRIKNKADLLANWQDSTGVLLDGEIAIVRVPTGESYTNPVTGKSEPVVELLMKVGDGVHKFNEVDSEGNPYLPWLSAKASDVYDWAKKGTAGEIPVTVNNTASTLGAYLTKVDTNASNISSVSAKVDVAKVSTAISNAINALDYSSSETDSSATKIAFVTAVTQTNGKIAVKKRNIIEADLPDISASKVKVDSDTTLPDKLSDMDSKILANTNKLAGHTDAAINSLINTKINTLDVAAPSVPTSGTTTATAFIDSISQTDGKITATKKNLPTASDSVAGITKLYTSLGTSTDGTVTRKIVTDINTQVQTNKADITNLKTAVAGGVHFRGTVSAAPSAATVTLSNGSTHTASAGDIVIYGTKEYIYTGSAWEVLGDASRIGDLETKINGLDVTTSNDVTTTNKFVSQVKQTDGKIAVTYTQPTSANVSHGSSDVKTALENLDANKANKSDVYTKTETNTKISDAINALDVSEPDASGTSTSFIATAKQDNGKIVVTKKNLPEASAGSSGAAGTKGIVALIDSTNSTSKVAAATPNSVKSAYDLASKAEADAAAAKAAAEHSHSNYVNQNAFSNIAVSGQTTVAADQVTDTVTFVGSNVSITTDATNGKVTFTVAKATADGKTGIVTLEDSVVNQSTTAATSKAVYTVNTKAADAQSRVAAVESNYVKFNSTTNKLYVGKDGADEIIFDCGGAI